MLEEPVAGSAEAPPGVDRRVIAFEDRYGLGAHGRLIRLLERPCVTFSAIALEFGVTRERVRQWQVEWLPASPRGRERRRRCMRLLRQRRVLDAPVFRAFYEQLKPFFDNEPIGLLRTRDGYRQRIARVNGHLVAIKHARLQQDGEAPIYALAPYRGPAAFVYFRLSSTGFLLVPVAQLPKAGTTFVDGPRSKYRVFRNAAALLKAPETAES